MLAVKVRKNIDEKGRFMFTKPGVMAGKADGRKHRIAVLCSLLNFVEDLNRDDSYVYEIIDALHESKGDMLDLAEDSALEMLQERTKDGLEWVIVNDELLLMEVQDEVIDS